MSVTSLTFGNNGAEIVSTNYWQHDLAARGLFFVSINAGTVRLLVPPSQEGSIKEMRTAKKIILTRGSYEGSPYDGRDMVEIMFDDRSDNPFAIFLDVAAFDRMWPPHEDGRKIGFAIYTKAKGRVWKDDCYLRRAALPCLLAWGQS